ncbi:MAG: orotate phosphoribosyltransferase [Candidatus Korarchaeota archaeon]|nr:orotate phosphoribosyltransferase [Candidatus Korarchaeota archaeon]NIU84249.1 orotate phosphoribosyltransferase [Candidatus Thorarchaeota archaeon]NIW14412.1 orotate phosphoribosyltransferase [Candidatus Thorarchaeota archaeon]NIW52481.1 orotate phosphoribosyltransferase [Candidatus Korarchaeota archaeon]
MKLKEQKKRELVLAIYNHEMVQFGSFKLTSGKVSPYYINLRKLISFPRLMKRIAKLMVSQMEGFDVVAGIATGGIPLSSFISAVGEIPGAYIRKEEKAHGISKTVEGDVEKKNVLVVDDVTTTGGSLIYGVKALRENNAIVKHTLVIVDREEGASERLKDHSVTLQALLTISEIMEILNKENLLTREEYQALKNYLSNKKS